MDAPGYHSRPVGAWVVFFIFGVMLVVDGLYLVALPSVDPDHWKSYTSDPDVVTYLAEDFRSTGGMTVAFGVLTALTAARWFRAGDRWAWYAFWTFPLLFGWEMATTWAVALWFLLLLVALAALIASYRRFFPS